MFIVRIIIFNLIFCSVLSAQADFGGYVLSDDEIITKSVAALVDSSSISSSVIIGDRYLLTAKHNQITDSTRISFGKTLFESKDKIRRIQKVIQHPNLDLAILVLDEEIPNGFTPVQLKAPMPTAGSLFLAGFGMTDIKKPSWPSRLKRTELPVESLQDPQFIRLEQIGSTGACSGDSGGPVYTIENNQIVVGGILHGGLMSHGLCLGSVLYTRIDIALDWIKENI